jgi:hypothetical protein
LEQAQSRLVDAQEAHREYLGQLEQVEQLQKELTDAQEALQLAEAARARLVSQQWQEQAERAEELADKHPTEPPDPAETRRQAQAVRTALDRWDHKPEPIEVSAPTFDELAKEIENLPPEPKGDTRPHNDVVQAKNAFNTARAKAR